MASTPWIFPANAISMADEYNGILYRNANYATNVLAEDGSFSDMKYMANGMVENAPLRVFGFPLASIPTGATITGFELRVSCYAAAPGQFDTPASDALIRPLIHSGRTVYTNSNTGAAVGKSDQIGQNLASSVAWPTPNAAAKSFRTYGGPTNMWGVTEAQLRNANFGFDLSLAGGGKNGAIGFVDSFQLRVHYEGGSAPEPTPGTVVQKSADFAITSNDADYTAAREGLGSSVFVNTDYRWIGQYLGGGKYDVNQTFLRFDTGASIPAAHRIVSAKLILSVAESYGSTVLEARVQEWSVEDRSYFVPGTALGAKTLLGSQTVPSGVLGEVSIDLPGLTRMATTSMVLAAAGQRLGVPTTDDDTLRITNARLEIVHEVDPNPPVARRFPRSVHLS